MACFWLDEHQQHVTNISLGLEWKTGIAAKDWDSVAKKEKIEGVELDLKRLEASVESIHQNLIYLKERESEMREVSERTNASVAWYSIMALGMCIAASGFQLWYLTRYFQKKKLI
ncbi:Transmembrane emp24 domain-containing protein p24delta3 [Linum perenne]